MSSHDWRWKIGEAIERIRTRYDYIGRKTGAPFLALVYPPEAELAVLKEWQTQTSALRPEFDVRTIDTLEITQQVLCAIGYEASHTDFTWRTKLFYLLRLVPMVERNYNLIELGPKETGKSFVFREISPYCNLLSGGQGGVTDLFGWKNRRDKPGLVVRYDVVAFDEVAGNNFKSANDKDMYKGYMEQGSFSRGDDKGTISAEAGIVFNGNIKGDIRTLLHTSHLLAALPEQIRDDDAFHDRWHAYLPGWEVPKLTPDHFTSHLGFIADYIAEIFHNELRPLNFTDACNKCFTFGTHLGHRDRKAVMRTVSGLIKLIHPDGGFHKEELAEYLHFAVEMRRRVKEQLRRINPEEFKKCDLSFVDKETGNEVVVLCPEYAQAGAGTGGYPSNNMPGTSRVLSAERPIEVFQHYELLQVLQAGGMAEAFRARDTRTGQVVFLKRVRTVSSDKDALERESRIYEKLMRTHCQHVLQVLDFVRDQEYVAIVTEFADGGDLADYVVDVGGGAGLTPAAAKQIALEVATAIQDLHGHDVVHRDLKPGNVLNAGGQWKLTDFGISKNLGRLITQKTFQQHGTLGYAAPEQFQGCAARPSADIYSLGKILVFLLTEQTDVDRVPYQVWRDLVVDCMNLDPDHRPDIATFMSRLRAIRT